MEKITIVALAILSVAVIAVIVSRNAQTTNVIASASRAFNDALGAALGPVSNSAF